jgi:uncharacterized protein
MLDAPVPTSVIESPLSGEIAPLPITDFLDESEPGDRPSSPPGPGLPEAFGWTFGVVVAHVIAGIIPLIAIISLMMFNGERPETATDIEKLQPHYLLMLLGGDQWLFLMMVAIAVGLRWGKAAKSRLNLTPMRPLHMGLVLGLVLPLSTLAGEAYRLTNLVWKPLVEQFPMLEAIDASNAVELLMSTANAGSLPIMLLIIAVAPAISEELVFRGMIGRGLVARWGVMIGVLVSSFLFAIVHLHPVHAAAVFPIGIALHFVYLWTRSFWAPVMLHFLNNAWATIASRMLSDHAENIIETPASPVLVLASIMALLLLGTALYRSRTRYLLPDGTEWDPGYVTAEQPPTTTGASIVGGRDSRGNLLFAGAAWASFTVAFIMEMTALAK